MSHSPEEASALAPASDTLLTEQAVGDVQLVKVECPVFGDCVRECVCLLLSLSMAAARCDARHSGVAQLRAGLISYIGLQLR